MMPGLGFFEAGLLRAKNSISVVTQVVVGLLILSTMWVVVGFSFTYGSTLGSFIGNPGDYPLFYGLHDGQCFSWAPGIPGILFASFQMMFAAITPLLQTGAIAGRMKWKAYFIYIVFWELLVYYPLAHWIWGEGWMSPSNSVLGGNGVYDFAGGIVIHTSAGIASLIAAIMLGRRVGFEEHNNGRFLPSNILLATVGTAFLWIGWFGFNGGSALASGALSAVAVLNTQIAASVCGIIWFSIGWFKGHPSLVESLNGAIAGLAGITPASGFVNPPAAFVIAIILGVTSFFGVILLKDKLKIDDALDVSVVHGLTGLLGSLAIGFAASKTANPEGPDGWFAGNPAQIGYQTLGIVVALVWSGFWSFVLLKILDLTVGLRVSIHEEIKGLDHAEHHEHGYGYLHKKLDITTATSDEEHHRIANSLVDDDHDDHDDHHIIVNGEN
eukprot:TRINITY_DN6615_c0_g1_i1.p1 TRINITY_DN6615_c0_g1~~TRINITY_DN6615_c0_g1_i1.p1  ORF type:complete len:441 (-),score=66.89 TRINITY_DN6615_c0_g1_i1:28-1350(-)